MHDDKRNAFSPGGDKAFLNYQQILAGFQHR